MTERVLGERGSKRRKRFVLLPVLATAMLALFYIAGAQAVHNDNLFELGPAQGADILGDDNPANGPDWGFVAGTSDDGLFDGSGNPVGLAGPGVAASFILDDTSLKGLTDRTTFSGAGGSNKNNDPISGAGDTWHWDGGNVPAKDDIVNAYAYAAIPTSGPDAGDLIIYGGFERLDESGDSHIDLEFFQDDVSLDEAIPCNDAGPDPTPCAFLGDRTTGDIIVSMDFVQGGGLGEVHIREWDGTTYVLDETLLGEGCNGADTACAFNNGQTINGGPWPNIDKSGATITELLPNAFTEFGINYTELVGSTPCISSVMAKTRSSQSFTAELKDFALTGFSICSLAWEKRNGATGALQTGATFSVAPNPFTGAGTLTGITDCTAAPCSGSDKDPDAGQYQLNGVLSGTYTITETAAPSGFAIDPDPTRVQTVGTGNLNAVVGTQGVDDKAGTTACDASSDECDFHNSRAVLKITGFRYTNSPTATPPLGSGVVSGTVVYTAAIHNYGAGAATLANSSLVVSSNASCTGGNTLAITGTVAAGADLSPAPTLTCTYTSLADGAVVTATLNINYGGGALAASGSPATISFTVQSD